VKQDREAAAAAEAAAKAAMEQELETAAAAEAAAEAAVEQEREAAAAAAAEEVRVARNRAKKHAKQARRKVAKATKANSSGALAFWVCCGLVWCVLYGGWRPNANITNTAPQLPKVEKAKTRRARTAAVVQVRWSFCACVR
jgi:hypothetical protein